MGSLDLLPAVVRCGSVKNGQVAGRAPCACLYMVGTQERMRFWETGTLCPGSRSIFMPMLSVGNTTEQNRFQYLPFWNLKSSEETDTIRRIVQTRRK